MKYSILKIVATMDCRKLEFKDGLFDVVVDKGTLDSLLCSDDAEQNAEAALSEIYRYYCSSHPTLARCVTLGRCICRVLTPSGSLVCISHGTEDERANYFRVSVLWEPWACVK